MPLPDDANVIWPGLALAARISSSTEDTPSDGCTTSTFGTLPINVTGAKSFARSGDVEFGNAALIVFAMVATNSV